MEVIFPSSQFHRGRCLRNSCNFGTAFQNWRLTHLASNKTWAIQYWFRVLCGQRTNQKLQSPSPSRPWSLFDQQYGSFLEEHLKLNLPKKISAFFWHLIKERLPSLQLLNKRMPHFPKECSHRGKIESIQHIFFGCSKAIEVWFKSLLGHRTTLLQGTTMADTWSEIMSILVDHEEGASLITFFIFLLWHIWRNKNLFMFEQQTLPSDEVITTLWSIT